MSFLEVNRIEPADVADADADGAFLDDLAATSVGGDNLRTGAAALPHFNATRDADVNDRDYPIVAWANQIRVSGDSVHGDVSPGTVVSPGATDVELSPPAGARGTLRTGDALRWHFTSAVSDVDNTGDPTEDRFSVIVEIDGTDDNGSVSISALDSDELGIVHNFSMSAGNASAAAAPPDGINDELLIPQRINASGCYIHDPEHRLVFSSDGGDVHIDAIRVRCYVQNTGNEVTLENPRLTAMICKG